MSVSGMLEAVARACSPRIETYGDDVVVFDASGLQRVLGPPSVIAEEVHRLAFEHGGVVHVALARTTTAAWLLARACPGITVVPRGEEARALSPLPLEALVTLPETGTRHLALVTGDNTGTRRSALGTGDNTGTRRLAVGTSKNAVRNELLKPSAQCRVPDLLSILSRWGLRTLGDLARLPRADLHARFGSIGVRWHQAASGEEVTPLVPAVESPRFAERLELEWPVENLEALSFVLARLCDDLSGSLERADRGAVTVTTRLNLVTRVTHERVLNLPAPMRDARVLRTLILLDLESHPPEAAIEMVEIEAGVTPGRILQGSLLTRALPSPENLATLIARLGALMGESRVGAPTLLDTHDERAVAMKEFMITGQGKGQRTKGLPLPCLRRFRLPIAARVTVEHGAPVRVIPAAHGLAGGSVVASAGPWRTSGHWWALDRTAWDRDEWDVELVDGGVYRLARDRRTGNWEIEGAVD